MTDIVAGYSAWVRRAKAEPTFEEELAELRELHRRLGRMPDEERILRDAYAVWLKGQKQ